MKEKFEDERAGTKQLVEFHEIDDGTIPIKAELVVQAFALSPEEQKKVLEELRAFNIRITCIEGDMVNGKSKETIWKSMLY